MSIPAGISKSIQGRLNAANALISVNAATIERKLAKHAAEGLVITDFALVQTILDEGEVTATPRTDASVNVAAVIGGIAYILGVKRSARGFLHVATLFRTGQERIKRLKRRMAGGGS